MAYTPPATNAVNFDLTVYTAPATNAVNFDVQPLLVVANATQVQTVDNIILTAYDPVATPIIVADATQVQTADNITLTVTGGYVQKPIISGGVQWHYNQRAVKEYEDEEAIVLLMWEMIN